MTSHRIVVDQSTADAITATVECQRCILMPTPGITVADDGSGDTVPCSCTNGRVPSPDRPTHVTSPVPVAKGEEVVLEVDEFFYLDDGSPYDPYGILGRGYERRERVVARATAAGDAHPLTPPGPDRLYRVPLRDVQEAHQ